MKKILFLFFMILGINIVLAQDFELENKIISIPEIKGFYMQGFTTVDDKILAIFITDDEKESIFKVFDINTRKEIFSKTRGNVGHANDLAYNNKEEKIYIVHGGGTDIVHVFDTKYNHVEDIKVGLPIRSLTYMEDKDVYIARTVASGFIYNSDFTLRNKLPFITAMNFSSDIARQGWSYHDGLLYYANWSWIRLGGDGSNFVRVYDLDGNKRDILNIKSGIGELEDVAFYDNKMVLGFDTYEGTIDFYLEDIPKIQELVVEEKKEEPKEKEKKNYNYVYFIIGFVIFFILGYIIKKRF